MRQALKVKTIQEDSLMEFELKINAFNAEHDVKATQTHVTPVENMFFYTAIIYYQEEN